MTTRVREKSLPTVSPEEKLQELIAANSVKLVFEEVPFLAGLSTAEYQNIRVQLKKAYGRDLDIRVLNTEVKNHKAQQEARVSKRNAEEKLQTSSKPVVIVNNRQLFELSEECTSVLRKANKSRTNVPYLFVRGSQPTRVRVDENNAPVIEALSVTMVQARLSEVAVFYDKYEGSEGEVKLCDTFPPELVAKTILSRGEWPFPPLYGVTESPILREDGTVLDTPGYDIQSRTLYRPSAQFPKVSDKPTKAEVDHAKEVLDKPFQQYPFVDSASKTNFIAYLFTAVVIYVLRGPTPLFAFSAPSPGSGKTTLAKSPGIITTGRVIAPYPETKDEEEMRKRILTALASTHPVVVFDNLKNEVNSAALEAVLTTTMYTDRLLTTNKDVTLPNKKVWSVTANNLRVVDDMRRRTVPIFLDANREKAWKNRKFDIKDVEEYILAHRCEMLTAVLTIARYWYASMCPEYDNLPTLGSFESWSRIVGNMLTHAGYTNFLGNHDQWCEISNDEELAWSSFFKCWYFAYGTTAVTTNNVVEDMKTPKTTAMKALANSLPPNLYEELERYRLGGTSKLARYLGNALSKRQGQVKGDYKLQRAGIDHKVVKWAMERLENGVIVEFMKVVEEKEELSPKRPLHIVKPEPTDLDNELAKLDQLANNL